MDEFNIESINPREMSLSDGSKWRFLGISPHPSLWQVGDRIVTEKKGKRFSLYRVVNKTRNQEAEAIPVSMSDNISKSFRSSSSEEKYNNLNTEIKIKEISGELFLLRDGSWWQVYNPTLRDPGSWEVGDAVIITRLVERSTSKRYQIKNVRTGRTLMGIFMESEQ